MKWAIGAAGIAVLAMAVYLFLGHVPEQVVAPTNVSVPDGLGFQKVLQAVRQHEASATVPTGPDDPYANVPLGIQQVKDDIRADFRSPKLPNALSPGDLSRIADALAPLLMALGEYEASLATYRSLGPNQFEIDVPSYEKECRGLREQVEAAIREAVGEEKAAWIDGAIGSTIDVRFRAYGTTRQNIKVSLAAGEPRMFKIVRNVTAEVPAVPVGNTAGAYYMGDWSTVQITEKQMQSGEFSAFYRRLAPLLDQAPHSN